MRHDAQPIWHPNADYPDDGTDAQASQLVVPALAACDSVLALAVNTPLRRIAITDSPFVARENSFSPLAISEVQASSGPALVGLFIHDHGPGVPESYGTALRAASYDGGVSWSILNYMDPAAVVNTAWPTALQEGNSGPAIIGGGGLPGGSTTTLWVGSTPSISGPGHQGYIDEVLRFESNGRVVALVTNEGSYGGSIAGETGAIVQTAGGYLVDVPVTGGAGPVAGVEAWSVARVGAPNNAQYGYTDAVCVPKNPFANSEHYWVVNATGCQRFDMPTDVDDYGAVTWFKDMFYMSFGKRVFSSENMSTWDTFVDLPYPVTELHYSGSHIVALVHIGQVTLGVPGVWARAVMGVVMIDPETGLWNLVSRFVGDVMASTIGVADAARRSALRVKMNGRLIWGRSTGRTVGGFTATYCSPPFYRHEVP